MARRSGADTPNSSARKPSRRAGKPRQQRAPSGKASDEFPIVGMGASAGGLEAFEKFFSHMPDDSNMAFVVVPHLDVHHKSAMVDLLRRYTRMKVVAIEDGMPVLANRVHVIPPNATLTLDGVALRLQTPRGDGLTIDTFFLSLAESQGHNAVGVILSGSGSDGTLGLRAIKEHGGLVLAQASESSRYDSMPRSAAATGLVDFVLRVEDMPAQLVRYAAHLRGLRRRSGGHLQQDIRKHLVKICTLLRARTGHDFSHYKENTFIRRLHRRMQVVQLVSVQSYVELLRKDPREADALFRDLLIGVTHFFRDPKAFDVMAQKVIPKIVEQKGPDDPIRIWVAGCATGEEAYSIAILLREHMISHDLMMRVQIFATDIDDRALNVARNGAYPATAVKDLAPERLDRFFVRDGDSYRIVKEVREMCIFSVHNLIKDAPFSRLDLVSCRNLLIYLDSELQGRVLLLFHFALRQTGYLFLGPSENVSQHPKLFGKIDVKHRLFKARPAESVRPVFDFPVTSSGHRNHVESEHGTPPARETVSRRAQRIVENFAPASVVIDENHEILHFSGRAGRFLQPSPGAASLNLFNIVDASLRPELRTAIHQAVTTGHRIIHENVLLPVNGTVQSLNIVAEPLPHVEGETQLCVVVFQEVGAPKQRGAEARDFGTENQKDDTIRHLEAELLATRERLQASVEELETSNEEMKSSNEEFQSVNEELQSSNEELETSKEELQSVNEELETVNAELNSKVESLDRAISDRKNLLESTQIATLFLDNNLRVRSFTPAMTEIFHLIESDYGRPITDIVTRLNYENLPADVARVLRTLTRFEKEVTLSDASASYIMRILPYRSVDNVINGVVVTFIDITERKGHEEARARLAALVDGSHDAIIGLGPDGTIASWNAGAERLYGYGAAEAVGRSLSLVLPEGQPDGLPAILRRLRRKGAATVIEAKRVAKDGREIDVLCTGSPIRASGGDLIGISLIEHDITERKRAEEQQKMLLRELNHRVKNTLATVLSIAGRTRRSSASLETFARSFELRIQALAGVHDLLAQTYWSGADMRQLTAKALAPYRAKRNVVLDGEALSLPPQPALTLALILQELATNGAKYGALSTPKGRVTVSWRIKRRSKPRTLEVTWTEEGGPTAESPSPTGFGLKFIERSMTYELDGRADFKFRKGGLKCSLTFPIGGETEARAARAGGRARPRKPRGERTRS